jgi:6-phosphogluconolactonase
MKIEVLGDADAVAKRAAAIMAAEARAACGGHTPWLILRDLAHEDVPWKNVHVVQVDERVAPPGDPDRNLTHLRESLLEHVPLPADQVYAMPVEAPDLDWAAAQYAKTLETIAGAPAVLDLVHLGLGPDGHTASLVPGDAVLGVTDKDVALTGVYMGRRRMTLTYPTINRARRVLWLVTGREKVPMFGRLRDADPSIPAGRIARMWRCCWPTKRRRDNQAGHAGISRRRGENMRLGIATDHGGLGLKEELIAQLRAPGHQVVDFGAPSSDPGDDYPDYVVPLVRAVAAGEVQRGIAICGSGVGASVGANRVPGVRTVLIHDHFSAKQGVEDDHIRPRRSATQRIVQKALSMEPGLIGRKKRIPTATSWIA